MDPLSFDIDTKKGVSARFLADTPELTLSDVTKLKQRRALVQLLFEPGALELNDVEVMSGAWQESGLCRPE